MRHHAAHAEAKAGRPLCKCRGSIHLLTVSAVTFDTQACTHGTCGVQEGASALNWLANVRIRPLRLDFRIVSMIVINQLNRHCVSMLLDQARTAPPPAPSPPAAQPEASGQPSQQHCATSAPASAKRSAPACPLGAAEVQPGLEAASCQASDVVRPTIRIRLRSNTAPQALPGLGSTPAPDASRPPPIGGLGSSTTAWLCRPSDVAGSASNPAGVRVHAPLPAGGAAPSAGPTFPAACTEAVSGLSQPPPLQPSRAAAPALFQRLEPHAASHQTPLLTLQPVHAAAPASFQSLEPHAASPQTPLLTLQPISAEVWDAQLRAVCGSVPVPAHPSNVPLLEELLSWRQPY